MTLCCAARNRDLTAELLRRRLRPHGFVGRRAELAELKAAYQSAATGGGAGHLRSRRAGHGKDGARRSFRRLLDLIADSVCAGARTLLGASVGSGALQVCA